MSSLRACFKKITKISAADQQAIWHNVGELAKAGLSQQEAEQEAVQQAIDQELDDAQAARALKGFNLTPFALTAKPAEPAAKAEVTAPAPATEKPAIDLPSGKDVQEKKDLRLAQSLYDRLVSTDTPITDDEFWKLAAEAYGGTRAEGAHGPSEAYDALEVAFNRFLENKAPKDMSAQGMVAWLGQQLERIPRQKNRSGEKDLLQQFSTPPHYAFTAAWTANIGAGDTVLEPSAGTGDLAVWAKIAGAKVVANELSARRGALLSTLGLDLVTKEDAEFINATLPAQMKAKGIEAPSVVVMNPPFSHSGERMGDKKIIGMDLRHVDAALKTLAPGGRLVAILGAPMRAGQGDTKTFQNWLKEAQKTHNVRANIIVERNVYGKYGTNFPTRIIVVDKTGATPSTGTIQKEVASLKDLVDTLEGIRNDRQRPEQTTTAASVPQGATGPAADGRDTVRPDAGTAVQPAVGAAGTVPPAGPISGTSGASGGGDGRGATGPAAIPAVREVPPVGGGMLPGPGISTVEQPGAVSTGSPGTAGSLGDGAKSGPPTGELGSAGLSYAEQANQDTTPKELSDKAFEPYVVHKARVEGAPKHPASVDESAAMAAVLPPDIEYKPKLPPIVVKSGALSDIQLERVAYAGAAHSKMLPPGKDGTSVRRGFMIGDGTGMGKTRSILGIILDNQQQGRSKSVIISKNGELLTGLRSDFSAVFGQTQDPKAAIRELRDTPLTVKDEKGNVKPGLPPVQHDGIIYTTYGTIRKGRRIEQLAAWLGKDFDGVIVFDESHMMGNALESESGRGTTEISDTAAKGLELQKMLPNARIVYSSATASTDVRNLAYAERLGLWGPATPFPTVRDFVAQIDSAGLSAMEQVAQDMKARGLYMAANITMNDGTPEGTVEYDRVMHQITPEQEAMYDRMAEAWSTVLRNINEVVEKHTKKPGAAMSTFWGNNQRFWSSILTTMSMPSMIAKMKEDMAAGRSVVIQLTETNDAATQRALDGQKQDEELEDQDLDLSPMDTLVGFVKKSFPVVQYVQITDQNGNEQWVPLKDSAGNLVLNPEAVAMRDALIADLESLSSEFGMLSPIDMIYQAFGGPDNVGEVTGRKTMITVDPKTGRRVPRELKKSYRKASMEAFQDGKKRILIFSRAGGTGFSFHASRNVKNQQRRAHYILQPGWSAAEALQGLGRTHRTNQVSAPMVRLVSTDLPSQKRFLSTVARRLDQLGAMSRGQRQAAGSGGVFSASDNLASREARKALAQFFDLLVSGRTEISEQGFTDATALNLRKKDGSLKEEMPKMEQVLNRLLTLPPKMQRQFFDILDNLIQKNTEQAARDGSLDMGLENFKADSVQIESQTPIFTDPDSGAQVLASKLKIGSKVKPISWEKMASGSIPGALPDSAPERFIRNTANGRLYAILPLKPEYDPIAGGMVERVLRVGQRGVEREYKRQIDKRLEEGSQWQEVSEKDAKAEWDKAVAALPAMEYEEGHLISGAILSVWDRLPQSKTKLYRVRMDNGKTMLGRILFDEDAADVLSRFNINVAQDAGKAVQTLRERSGEVELANRWKLKPVRVGGENRIELLGPTFAHQASLKNKGLFIEKVQFTQRYFVPTGEKMEGVVRALADQYGLHRVYNATESAGEQDRLARQDTAPRPVLPPLGARTTAEPLVAPHELVVEIGNIIGRDVKLGAVTLPRATGEYMPGFGKVAISRNGDISAAIHEIAHAIDDKFGVLKAYKDQRAPFESQLLAFVPPKLARQFKAWERRFEGLAYFLEQWVVNPDLAMQRAPKVWDHLRSKIPADVLGRLEAQAERIREWAGGSATEQGRANIRMEQKRAVLSEIRASLRKNNDGQYRTSFMDGLAALLTDRLAPLMSADKWLKKQRGITSVSEGEDASILIRLISGHEGKLGEILDHGMIDFQGNVIRHGMDNEPMNLAWLLAPFDNSTEATIKDDMHDTVTYMAAERTVEKATQEGNDWRNIAGLSGGMLEDWRQAQEILGEFNDGDQKKLARIKEGARRYRALADAVLRYLVDAGRISEDTYRDIKKRNQFYLDMHRALFPGESAESRGVGGALGRSREPIKSFRGSTRMIENPYMNLLQQLSQSVYEADRNAAMRSFTDLLDTGRKMHDDELLPADTSSVGWTVPAGTADAIKVYRGGEVTYYRFEQGVQEALKSWGSSESSSLAVKILKWLAMLPARTLRAGVIYSPPFMLMNPIKDIFHRTLVTRSASGVKDMFAWTDEEMRRWRAFGGSQAGIYGVGKDGYQRALKQAIKEAAGDRRSILIDPVRWGRGWARTAEKTEELGRMAEFHAAYAKAKAEGKSDRDANLRAAFESRSLLDYAVAGTLMKMLNPYIAFLNPGIQAVRRTAQAGREDPKKLFNRWVVYTAMPELSSILWNYTAKAMLGAGDDDPWEEFGQLPANQRDMFYNFWVGKNSWVKAPKPYEMGILASGFGRAIEAALGRKNSFEGYVSSVANASPIDMSNLLGPVKGPIEYAFNKNTFTGRNIVPSWEEKKALELREGTKNASRIGQIIQSIAGIDARHVDNIVQTNGGGLGRMAIVLSNLGREDKAQGSQRLAGVLTGYMAESPAWSARDVMWVMEEAAARGEQSSRILKTLRGLLKDHGEATDSASKARLGTEVRAEAARVRSHYEQTPRMTAAEITEKRANRGASRDPFGSLFGGSRAAY